MKLSTSQSGNTLNTNEIFKRERSGIIFVHDRRIRKHNKKRKYRTQKSQIKSNNERMWIKSVKIFTKRRLWIYMYKSRIWIGWIQRIWSYILLIRTWRTDVGHPGPTNAGTPDLKIPAFFCAISSTVDPRIRVWSSAVKSGRKFIKELITIKNINTKRDGKEKWERLK